MDYDKLIPKDRKLTEEELAFERVAKEYEAIFGDMPRGLEYPDITIELLQKAIDDDQEIQTLPIQDNEVS